MVKGVLLIGSCKINLSTKKFFFSLPSSSYFAHTAELIHRLNSNFPLSDLSPSLPSLSLSTLHLHTPSSYHQHLPPRPPPIPPIHSELVVSFPRGCWLVKSSFSRHRHINNKKFLTLTLPHINNIFFSLPPTTTTTISNPPSWAYNFTCLRDKTFLSHLKKFTRPSRN